MNSLKTGHEKAVLRMYGITENGNSVMVHIHNFLPYFYVQLNHNIKKFDDQDMIDLKAVIN